MKGLRVSTVQLIIGVAAALVTSIFLTAPPFLIPVLVSDLGFDLPLAGLLVVLPNLGMVSMLIVWGGLADRFGERIVLIVGLGLTTVVAFGAAFSTNSLFLGACLLLGGMCSASANVATGRIVIGWAPVNRRGLAMGVRQMAIPLGIMISALTVPPLAQDHGLSGAMLLPAVACAIVVPWCVVGLRNPNRNHPRVGGQLRKVHVNPYKSSRYLLRIHTASTALAVPQFALQVFGLVWFMESLGWGAVAAGLVVGVSQFLGAMGRVIVGAWSDVLGRMRTIRVIAAAGVLTLILLGFSSYMDWNSLAGLLYIAATCLSVADNGPAFTAVAEYAGPFWSGRALGLQNTMQHFAGFIVGPTLGTLIEYFDFAVVFAALAVAPAAALWLIHKNSPGAVSRIGDS